MTDDRPATPADEARAEGIPTTARVQHAFEPGWRPRVRQTRLSKPDPARCARCGGKEAARSHATGDPPEALPSER